MMKAHHLLCVVAGALAIAFSLVANKDCFEIQPDGAAWQTYLDYQSHDRAAFSELGVDALQGNFDAYYPLINDFTIPGFVYRVAGKTAPSPTVTYGIYCLFLCAGMLLLCRSFQVKISICLVAVLIAGFFFLPLIVHQGALTFRFFQLNPHWIQLIILSSAIILSVWTLDGKWSPSRFILIVVPALCTTLEILSVGAMIIFTPVVALYCGGSLLFSRNKSEIAQKLLAAAIALAVIVLTGGGAYLYGLEQYSAYQIFGSEFDWDEPTLGSLSIFFSSVPFGTLLIGLGVLGAVTIAIEGNSRLRWLAMTHLGATAVFFMCGAGYYIWASSHPYRGSAPFYFETIFLPFAALFAAIAMERALRLILTWSAALGVGSEEWARGHTGDIVLWVGLAALAGYNLIQAGLSGPGACTSVQIYARLRPTPIIQLLHRSIALQPGMPFRGSVVTIDWPDNLPAISYLHMNRQNNLRWTQTGNEHRISGLWRYDIPTMYQYFTFITAPYYLVLTEFLARPADRQTRSGLILTHEDPKMLRLWGVRYIITDQTSAEGRELVSLPLPNRPSLRLLELDKPNVGDYSPTQVKQAIDFHAGLVLMHEPDFDGSETVVADTPIDGPLTPAARTRLTYETYGFHIEAESAGKSVLVLPVQFSRCWSAEGDGFPILFRADLMQLGIEFAGKLDARLVFRYGPLFAA